MKSINTLIATLIIGASSLAAAEPVVRDHRDFAGDSADSYIDHRRTDDRRDDDRGYQDDRFGHFRRRVQITLADNIELGMRRPTYVALDPRFGGFRRLRLDADEGRAFIDSVIMMFPDGSSQSISIRQRISGRSAPLTINIDARATGVWIYGSTRGRGSLDVIGVRR